MIGWEYAATALFDALRAAGYDGVGITRESYGAGETAASALIGQAARTAGLVVSHDGAANLHVCLHGTEPDLPEIACGSHLDSVPQGGNFDGAAGVVAGLLALARLREDATPLRRTLRLVGLRGEESAWYGRTYLGSRALLGQITAADLAATHARSGATLAQAMTELAIETAPLAAGQPMLPPARLAAWLELHIEQGPVLVARHLPVAIVTGIRGNIRHRRIGCIGSAGHSGAVPRWLRHDAVFAVADLLMRLDQHWQSLLGRGGDLVVTTGIAGTDPAEHALSRIPGQMHFSFEARSESHDTLEDFYALMRSECDHIAEERGVRFDFDARVDSAPAQMAPEIVALLGELAHEQGLPAETMASGAGHDAAVFANAGIPAGMIFVRNAHGSHNPQEAMAMADFLDGTHMLYHALRRLAA